MYHVDQFRIFIPARTSKYPALLFLISTLKNTLRKQLRKNLVTVYTKRNKKDGSAYRALYHCNV